MSSFLFRKDLLYGNTPIKSNQNALYVNQKNDTIKLQTKNGFIEVVNECDSVISGMNFRGYLFSKILERTIEESGKTKIYSDQATLF